jgi:hypothetical protein
MEDFVAYESRSSLAFVLLMIVPIFLAGLWMGGIFGTVPYSPKVSHREIVVIGWCLVLFSGFCGFAIFKSFLNPSEQLRIGPHGIRFANWSDDTIPWSEITRVTIRDIQQGRYGVIKAFVLYLRNPDRFPGRGLGRIVAEANTGGTYGALVVTLRDTNRNFADALSAIQRFKQVD